MSSQLFPQISKMVAGLLISVATILLSTACAAPSSNPATEVLAVRSTKGSVGSCVVADRPKHTIRQCGCVSGAFAGITSIDAKEVFRLLTGDQGCRRPAQPRQ